MKVVVSILILLLTNLWNIWPVERAIVYSPTECVAGYTPSQTLLFEVCGSSNDRFLLTPDEVRAVARGGILTHNHPPIGCWVLSGDDIFLAEQLQLSEIRAVSLRNGVLRVSSMRRAGGIFPYIPPAVIDAQARIELAKGNDPDGCTYLSRTWADLAPRYGLVYTVFQSH